MDFKYPPKLRKLILREICDRKLLLIKNYPTNPEFKAIEMIKSSFKKTFFKFVERISDLDLDEVKIIDS